MQDAYSACGGTSKKRTGFHVDKNNKAKIQTHGDREFGKVLKSTRWGQAHKTHQSEIQVYKMQESAS